MVPILFEGEVKGVIELASFHRFTTVQLAFIDQLLESLGIVVATIEATMRTDELLRQSQSMAEELQTQQEELQQTNEELEEKARQLTEQKGEVERKNREVELAKARARGEGRAAVAHLEVQVAVPGQHVPRAAHAAQQPADPVAAARRQPRGQPQDKQVEFAQTIHQSGADLLALINEILDLAKIESGTMASTSRTVRFATLQEYVERSFRHLAEEKGLLLGIELDEGLPPRCSRTTCACARCCATCSPTPSSSPSRAASPCAWCRCAGVGVPAQSHGADPELLLQRHGERVGIGIARTGGNVRAEPAGDLLQQGGDALGEDRDLLLLQQDAHGAGLLDRLQVERAVAGLADGPGDESLGLAEDVDDA